MGDSYTIQVIEGATSDVTAWYDLDDVTQDFATDYPSAVLEARLQDGTLVNISNTTGMATLPDGTVLTITDRITMDSDSATIPIAPGSILAQRGVYTFTVTDTDGYSTRILEGPIRVSQLP